MEYSLEAARLPTSETYARPAGLGKFRPENLYKVGKRALKRSLASYQSRSSFVLTSRNTSQSIVNTQGTVVSETRPHICSADKTMWGLSPASVILMMMVLIMISPPHATPVQLLSSPVSCVQKSEVAGVLHIVLSNSNTKSSSNVLHEPGT